MSLTLAALRRHAIARSLFTPTTLARAIERLGFVQADPIRAPARAQDLTLRHRVRGYRAGDLERRYPRLGIEEDFFVNYGFMPRHTHVLMHPRAGMPRWPVRRATQAAAVLEFVRAQVRAIARTHPCRVDGEATPRGATMDLEASRCAGAGPTAACARGRRGSGVVLAGE